MKKINIPTPDVSVFIKLLDRGFKLSVPADQEKYYRDGYDLFMQRVNQHKTKIKGYDDIEAIGLTAIECMVALQQIREQMDGLTAAFQDRVDKLDAAVAHAIED